MDKTIWVCKCDCGTEKKVNIYSIINESSKNCRNCSTKGKKRKKIAKNLGGEKFNDWTVLSRSQENFKQPMWLCRCKCGIEKIISGAALRKGRSKSCKSCSYKKKPKQFKIKNDLMGKFFGKWVVVKRSDNKYGRVYWKCLCACGHSANVSSQSLKDGSSKCCLSCSPRLGNPTHGLTRGGKPKLYYVWRSIKDRCLNSKQKNFKNYGGRGIKICIRWENSFKDFYSDVGDRPFEGATLDRINNDGDYEPGNVRWATRSQQAANTRKQKYGVSVTQWSRDNNLDRFHVKRLLDKGKTFEEIKTLVKKEFSEY